MKVKIEDFESKLNDRLEASNFKIDYKFIEAINMQVVNEKKDHMPSHINQN